MEIGPSVPKEIGFKQTLLVLSFIYSTKIYVPMFETYLLQNGWTDLKNSFSVSLVLVRGRF